MAVKLSQNMAHALLRLAEGEVIIYMRGNQDQGGIWCEGVYMSKHPQLGLRLSTYKRALEKGWIERKPIPRDAPNLYRADPERYQAYLITASGFDALNAYCMSLPDPVAGGDQEA